ncbi:hypothetical protein KZ873_32495, partial [Pseudomonas aeruginosa]|nr:hypothetical protein [Pseudomonas aeruginosa]
MISNIANDRGMSIDAIRKTVRESMMIAYKKYFGTSENALVKFDEDTGDLVVYSKKKIVEKVQDDILEISKDNVQEFEIMENGYAYVEIDP